MSYSFAVSGGKRDKATRRARLLTHVRVLKSDGSPVYAGPWESVESTGGTTAPLPLGGTFDLAAALSPGEYVLQVVVVDGFDRRRVVTQSTDFSVDG